MDKESGVYIEINDNTFETPGVSSMKVLVPMCTTKGEIGLNLVDANNFKDILGYDLDYNPNYYGLNLMLENLSYAYVWRLNQDAKLDNAYFTDTSAAKASNANATTFSDVTGSTPLLAVALKNPGKPQTTAVKFEPTYIVTTEPNNNPDTTTHQEITLTNVSPDESKTFNGEIIKGGCIFYDALGTSVVGIIKQVSDSLKVYKVVDNALSDVCGTASWGSESSTANTLSIELSAPLSKESYYTVKTIPPTITEWTLICASYDGNTYNEMSRNNFSTNSFSDIYWKNVAFKNIDLYLKTESNVESIPSDWLTIRDYFQLENGSNGVAVDSIVAANIDTTPIDKAHCNVIATNGITDSAVINRIAQKAEKSFTHTFADAPADSSYTNIYNWRKNLYSSEYLAVGARPDQVKISATKSIYVYPSVNYVLILSRMQDQYHSLNYPPAGFTYGKISVENLIECDYDRYGDELKTNRINWQRTKNRGSVMWEQRTTYSKDGDLSYIAPVFIIDGLREQLQSFEEQFNFRYMSPTDLLNQESGIKSILDSYVTQGFIFRYELNVPTYSEAQEAGRTLVITIGVSIAKDSEVIYININLNN